MTNRRKPYMLSPLPGHHLESKPTSRAKGHSVVMDAAFERAARALSGLLSPAAVQLADDGWLRRGGYPRTWSILTKPLESGSSATVEVKVEPISRQTWPLTLATRLGAGYEPATALMEVVSLPWRSALLHKPVRPGADALTASGPEDGDRVSDWIIAAAEEAVSFAGDYPSVAALDAALATDVARHPQHEQVELRAVLLASSGQLEAAIGLLDDYRADDLNGNERAHHAVFDRQLRRWLADGGPPIPSLERTLNSMPRLGMD